MLRDHPRVCGEKHHSLTTVTAKLGSPPRVRGKATMSYAESAEQRITPACAGKRNSVEIFAVMNEDHPRVCGEKCI